MLLISEVLDLANKQASPDVVAKALKAHNSLGLRDVLRIAFDDSITINLPTGAPSYKSPESTDGSMPSNLIRRTPELAYLVKGHPQGDKLNPLRRESLFLGLIEGIDPRDAAMLILAKDKSFSTKWPNVTKDVVKAAFPKLLRK